jgi:hypothetical protein
MPIVLPRESIDQVYGTLSELTPSPEERRRARFAVVDEALDNLSSSVAAVSVARHFHDRRDERRVSAAEASAFATKLGVDNLRGVGEDGISPRALEMIVARQVSKRKRFEVIQAAQLGGVENLALTLVGSTADPINLVSFGVGGRVRSAGLAANAARGFATGAAANAAVEPLFFSLSRFSGDDYRVQDSILNIVLGGALGTGFHLAGSVIGNVRERRAVAPIIKAQAANGMPIDVGPSLRRVSDANPDQVGTPIQAEVRPQEGPSRVSQQEAVSAAEADIEARVPVEEAVLRQSASEGRGLDAEPVRGPAAYSIRGRQALAEVDATKSTPVTGQKTTVDRDLDEITKLADEELSELDLEADQNLKTELSKVDEQFKEDEIVLKSIEAAVTCGMRKGAP